MKSVLDTESHGRATVSAPRNKLKPEDGKRLTELEAVVERGLHTFREVGEALLEIKEKGLHKEVSRDFNEYCRLRFDISRSHADRFIEAAKAMKVIAPLGVIPESESVLRPIMWMPPAKQKKVWEEVTKQKPERITGRLVQRIVRKVYPKRSGPRKSADRPATISRKGLIADLTEWWDGQESLHRQNGLRAFRAILKFIREY